jgi:cyclic-di-AMP phosphodiesterase PgpH
MAIPNIRKESATAQMRKKLGSDEPHYDFFSRIGLLYVLVFILFSALVIEICFAGLSPAGPQVVKGQMARTRIIAELPFSYVSEIETERTRAEVRQRTPPVYAIDMRPAQDFRKWVLAMDEALAKYLSAPGMAEKATEGPQNGILKVTPEEMDVFLRALPGGNAYNINGEDLAALSNTLGREQRTQALDEGMRVLTDLYRQGIYSEVHNPVQASGSLSFMKISANGGGIEEAEVLGEEQAKSDLKINLSSLEIPREAFVALFRIMRAGMEPNLVFDQTRTSEIIEASLARMPASVVNVRMGETIVEPGMRVGELQFEQLQAYRKALRENEDSLVVDSQFFDRAVLAMATIIAMTIYLRMYRKGALSDLLMACIAITANLGLIRLVLAISEGSVAQTMPELALVLVWLAPVALGPIVMAILQGSGAGMLTACVIAVFNALMQGGSMAVAMATLLSGLAGVYACRSVQVRTRVVRAGVVSGIMMAAIVLVLALRDGSTSTTGVLLQVAAALLNGCITGIAALGLLPIFEHLFRHTTDITLLELTDFNHPLLRRLQVAAPGSYHHSLMVANLAENAALRVGANSLACRVASLYHDIGKIIKPEYFIENKREASPHMERNPSMSALIIKAHVKEGVVMARQYGLPKIVTDVIQQHHGTALIQYFYHMAMQRQQDANAALVALPASAGMDVDEVAQSTYRYEGPKPQSVESAIVMLADAIEAASRSLKKVTPQSIEDFVNGIVQSRIDDGQLDEAPITMRQIALIRESFVFTLLNMLHSRIEYPKNDLPKKLTHVSVQPVVLGTLEKSDADADTIPGSAPAVQVREPTVESVPQKPADDTKADDGKKS